MSKFYEFNGHTYELPDEATNDQINSYILSKSQNVSEGQQKPQQDESFISNIGLSQNVFPGMARAIEKGSKLIPEFLDLGQSALSGLGKGLGKGGESIASLLTGGGSPQVNWEEIEKYTMPENKSVANEIASGIGSYLPYGKMGSLASSAISKIPGISSNIAQLLGQSGAGGLFGATMTKPEEQNLFGLLPEGKVGGSLEGAILNAVPFGLARGLEQLRPSKLFRGNLTPEQLARNVEVAQGTRTGIGDIIESPRLKTQYENVLSKLPLSNVTEKIQETGQSVIDRGNEILKKVLGKNNSENVPEQVFKVLNKEFKSHRTTKQNLYNDVDELADKVNLNLELPNFTKKANEYYDAINQTNLLKYEPSISSIFNKLRGYKEPNITTPSEILNAEGKPFTHTTTPQLKEANILKGKLGEYAKKAKYDPNLRGASHIFEELNRALKSDIQSSIKNSGNKKLIGAYDLAEENYKRNFSPFLDRDIYKYVSGKETDSDKIITSFLKTSKTSDRSKTLTKLTSKLPDKSKQLIGYSYLSRALDNEGNLNPAKLSTLIKNLGKNQFKTLFPNAAIRKELQNYTRLYKMNTKAANIMFNPMTGQQNLDILPAVLAHVGSSALGGKIGGLPGAIVGALTPGLAARGIVNKMTDPVYREKLVNAMIENKPWELKYLPHIQSILQGVSK